MLRPNDHTDEITRQRIVDETADVTKPRVPAPLHIGETGNGEQGAGIYPAHIFIKSATAELIKTARWAAAQTRPDGAFSPRPQSRRWRLLCATGAVQSR